MKNGYDNDIVAGIDIGSENIFCSIGIVEENKNNIKLLGLGKSSVKDSFKKGAITNRNKLLELLEIAVNEAELMAEIIKLGHEIRNREEIDLPVLPLSTEQSKFFKSVYMNSPRIFKKRKL